MTGAEDDVAFSCVLNSVITSNNDVCFLAFFFLLKRILRPWDRGTEHPSVSLFIHNLPFIHVCLQWSAEWVACTSLGQQLPLLCWMTKATAGDDHSPVIPAVSWNVWACRKGGCEQQYFGGWSSVGSRGQPKHAPAQEKDSWSLEFFLVQLSLVDEQKLPPFWNKSELQTHPLSNFCKGTAGATWAQRRLNPLIPESRGRAWSEKSTGLGAEKKMTLGEEWVCSCACEHKIWALFLLYPLVASWTGMQFLVVLPMVLIHLSRHFWFPVMLCWLSL